MQKASTTIIGIVLILFGTAVLALNTVLPALGLTVGWFQPWSTWPMFILALGSGLLLLALLSFGRPGLGALFIPALPINMVGMILLYASVFNQWHIWSFAWSFIILALAAGFLLATVFTRNLWLGIPTILIGANALVLTFCSLTGLWSWWAVLWTVEPLALGLVFFLIAYQTRSTVLLVLGLITCGFAASAFTLMSGIAIFGSWIYRFSVPSLLILLGLALLGWSMVRRPVELARE